MLKFHKAVFFVLVVFFVLSFVQRSAIPAVPVSNLFTTLLNTRSTI